MADQPTFTAEQLNDAEFFRANRRAIFEALRDGRVIADPSWAIGNGTALAAAVHTALDGIIGDTRPASGEPAPGAGNLAKATSPDNAALAAALRKAFGLG